MMMIMPFYPLMFFCVQKCSEDIKVYTYILEVKYKIACKGDELNKERCKKEKVKKKEILFASPILLGILKVKACEILNISKTRFWVEGRISK